VQDIRFSSIYNDLAVRGFDYESRSVVDRGGYNLICFFTISNNV